MRFTKEVLLQITHFYAIIADDPKEWYVTIDSNSGDIICFLRGELLAQIALEQFRESRKETKTYCLTEFSYNYFMEELQKLV